MARTRGAPNKKTPERLQYIIELLAAGNSRATIYRAVNISEATFKVWYRNDLEFHEAVEKAEAEAIIHNVALIRKAANDNWTAAAWWLERKYPDEWGRKDVLKIEREKVIQETRRLAEAQGLNGDAAVAEVELLMGFSTEKFGGRNKRQ